MLTRYAAVAVLNSVIVAPATRSIRGISTEVFLDATDGMPQECVLSLDNVTILPKRLLTSRITTLDTARMEQVCQALRIAVECG